VRGRRTLGRAVGLLRRLVHAERPVILMYHRIAAPAHDPWQIAVAPETFDRQMEMLKHERQVVPLSWLVDRLERGLPARRAAAITFDDGYVDVLVNGRPVLEKHGCPATMYLCPGLVGDPAAFWWDTVTRIFLDTPKLPERLDLPTTGGIRSWAVPPSGRGAVHLEVWAALRTEERPRRRELVDRLVAWAGVAAAAPEVDRCMTEAQCAQLLAPGFIDAGAHTMTHPSLPTLPDDEKAIEIEGSIRGASALFGRPVTSFAYPYGDADAATVRVAGRFGLKSACTTQASSVGGSVDRLRLPRIQAVEEPAERLARRLASHA
jgi:peptidoglycan/xylan/chitin deacetylase (PgdA/CDA1 family)